MTARTKQLGEQAMDALEKAVLSALVDAENGECFNVTNCKGNDGHGPACITKIAGINPGINHGRRRLNDAIAEGTLQYLESKDLVEKPRGYRLTALGRKSFDGNN